jgi:hypothetical protein
MQTPGPDAHLLSTQMPWHSALLEHGLRKHVRVLAWQTKSARQSASTAQPLDAQCPVSTTQ